MIGGSDQNILYFQIEDEFLLEPQQVREVNFDFNVTCIAPFDLKSQNFLIGQEKGRINILDIRFMEKKSTFTLDTH